MTEKLFYKDAYIIEFEANVLSCEKENNLFKIILDKTAFFPEGGGQTSDTGYIGDAKVTDVQEKGEKIIHFADKEVSGKVLCKLDFERRYVKMQNHTGEHLMSGIAHKLFGAENVGFHLGDDVVTMDYDIPLTKEQLALVELEANKAVYANTEIISHFPKPEELENLTYRAKLDLKENVRIIEIKDYDMCACCAPHVKRTGEVGLVKIVESMNWKGGTRIFIHCGLEGFLHYRQTYDTVKTISGLLSAKQESLVQFVEKYMEDTNKLKYELEQADVERARLIASSVEETADSIVVKDNFLKAEGMRELVNLLKEKTDKCVCALTGEEGAYRFIIGANNMPLRNLIKDINDKLNGKGGGGDQMVQGNFSASFEEIEKVIKEI